MVFFIECFGVADRFRPMIRMSVVVLSIHLAAFDNEFAMMVVSLCGAAEVQLRNGGVEAQADVVGNPIAVCVAEDRLEERYGLVEDGGAIDGVEVVEDSIAEGVEP